MTQTKIEFNLKGLDDLRRQMGGAYVARVGILGGKAVRTDSSPLNNAEIGVIQMFGSYTKKIPPRDFLLAPIQRNQRKIIEMMQKSSIREAVAQGDYKKIFQFLGVIAEGFVQQAFETSGFGQWAPNKPTTVQAKGSDKPLIDTGQLRRAITSDVAKKGQIESGAGNISSSGSA